MVDRSIAFIGDLMIGDTPITFGYGINSKHNLDGYSSLFKHLNGVLQKNEINIANFEATIKPRVFFYSFNEWELCCDERICEALLKANIRVVSLANNHSMDYGKQGFVQTRRFLESYGITVIGIKEKPYEIFIINQTKIAIIGISYINSYCPNPMYYYKPSKSEILNLLDEIGNVDLIIAYVHWGSEFILYPDMNQYSIANQLIDCGIDAIIGHHSHIVQESFYIKGKPVFFSLGNFVSDYWQKRFRSTIICKLSISKSLKWNKYSCLINMSGQPVLLSEESDVIFNSVNYLSSSNRDILFARYYVRLEYLLKILFNFYKIKNKAAFLRWLYLRFKYVLTNALNEYSKPGIIYEKYRD